MIIDIQLLKVQTHSSHSLWHYRNMYTNIILFSAVVLFARPTFRPQKIGLRANEREISTRLRETLSLGGRFSKGGGLRLLLTPSDNPCGGPRSLTNNTYLTVTQHKLRTRTTGLDANSRTRELEHDNWCRLNQRIWARPAGPRKPSHGTEFRSHSQRSFPCR